MRQGGMRMKCQAGSSEMFPRRAIGGGIERKKLIINTPQPEFGLFIISSL